MRRRSGQDIPETIEDACDPATMALIVYDMQAGVLSQLPDGAETLERVSKVLTAARAGGYPVFYTRHMSLPPRLMGTAQLRTAMAWQQVNDPEKVQSWFLRDTPGFQIVPDLAPRADEAVFDKLAMSAFAGTPLAMALRDLGVRSFAIVGVALEIGIAPTIWHAVDLGLIPVVVTDACGGRDGPAMQRRLGQHPVLRRRAANRHLGAHTTADSNFAAVKAARHEPPSDTCAYPPGARRGNSGCCRFSVGWKNMQLVLAILLRLP